MKLATITYTFSLFATSNSLSLVGPKRNDVAFLGMNASCSRKATGKPKGHGYGKSKCPCVGIDNLRGYFSSTLDYHMVQYPLEVGASCSNWEKGIHPECKGEPSPEWCREDWCYVDPCECDLDVLPKRTRLGVTYQGNAAYYSYATCSAFDFWTEAKDPEACIFQKDAATCATKPDCAWDGKQCRGKEAVETCGKPKAAIYGNQDCRCVGFGGHKNGKAVRYINENEDVSYNSNVGSSCEAWELTAHPECKKDGAKPAWCSQKWCYVDPCKCNIGTDPRAVMESNSYEMFQGKTAFFSYETCGSVDHWTDTMKEQYCHAYTTEATCKGMDKCMWTGKKCTSKALGEVCAEQAESGILGIESGASGFRPFAALLLAFGFFLG